MDWADDVAAIVQVWNQGQEAINALANEIPGKANPSGKLPGTSPRRIENNPHPVIGPVRKIGYRHSDRTRISQRFAFGHELSYTMFSRCAERGLRAWWRVSK